jgi:hypothetical protein
MNRLALKPLNIAWTCKAVETAKSDLAILADGRLHCWIEHELIRGVTPQMLVWWFKHLEGEVSVQGERLSRYRLWHPRDHIAIEYSRRNCDGSVGVGCVIHLTEMLGGDERYLIDTHTEILKLDEQGFIHRPKFHGMRLALMEYEFEPREGGVLYRNSLTVGARGFLGRVINPCIRAVLFGEERARAWIKHNVEEVGNFESFLPSLYAARPRVGSEAAMTSGLQRRCSFATTSDCCSGPTSSLI